MSPEELQEVGRRLLAEALELRAAFPDVGAMAAIPVSDIPASGNVKDGSSAALRYLLDEMVAVRAGRAKDLTVLDDEIAGAQRLLARD